MEEDILLRGCQQLGIELTGEQLLQFDTYLSYLKETNEQFNLTAITEDREIIVRHFLDSLIPVKSRYFNPELSTLDIGSGAGFPAVPLKIIYPEMPLELVEATEKKADFLEKLALKLSLKNIKIHNQRAETLAHNPEFRHNFEQVLARAVAPLVTLSEYSLPFLRLKGFLFAFKGRKIKFELEEAETALKILGGKLEEIETFSVPFLQEERFLAVIRKKTLTDPLYPRRTGLPKKKPLGLSKIKN